MGRPPDGLPAPPRERKTEGLRRHCARTQPCVPHPELQAGQGGTRPGRAPRGVTVSPDGSRPEAQGKAAAGRYVAEKLKESNRSHSSHSEQPHHRDYTGQPPTSLNTSGHSRVASTMKNRDQSQRRGEGALKEENLFWGEKQHNYTEHTH